MLLRPAERLKDERELVRRNGRSLVADLDDNLRSFGACLDDHDRPRRGVLDGVPCEVGDDLRQPILVPGALHVAFDDQPDGRFEFFDDVSADLT